MTKEEYLASVEEQIHCKKAREAIGTELANHISDQTEAYCRSGMTEEEALEKAVADMGDPVVTGQRLDSVHSPKKEWFLPLLAICLSVAGIVVQCLLFAGMDNSQVENSYYIRTIVYNLIGIAVMTGFCLFDYRLFGRHIWHLFAVYQIVCILLGMVDSLYSHGSYWIAFRMRNQILWLFIPVFAGFIYHFRNQGVKGILKSVGVLFLELLLANYFFSAISGAVLAVMLIVCSLSVCAAAFKGIYGGSGKKQLAVIASVLGGIGVLAVMFLPYGGTRFLGFSDYQMARLTAMLHMDEYADTFNYMSNVARRQLEQAQLFGGQDFGILGASGSGYSDYLLTCVASYFGIAALAVLVAVVMVFSLRALRLSWKQKNRLGFLLGVSASLLLLLKSILYLLANFGIISASAIDMPFLSFGIQNTIVNYLFLGIILSVYRYSSVFSVKEQDVQVSD